jgi:hypothetical protein
VGLPLTYDDVHEREKRVMSRAFVYKTEPMISLINLVGLS